nr:hypothetical protein [Streptococcus equi]
MKYLNLKLRRDLKHHWQQFFSVFLMSLLSVLIFVGLQGAWHGLEKSLDNYISASHLPTVWVQATNLTKQDIEKIEALNHQSAGSNQRLGSLLLLILTAI